MPPRPLHWLALALALAVSLPTTARADKLRDLCEVFGARDNQLVGYGIVTGLRGTGDDVSAPLATQSTLAMLRRLGVQVEAGQLQMRNVAAVVVTATIPPFAVSGTRLDVTVSSIGNAKSLAGGVLVQTPLKGADRRTYAVAQGDLVLGGYAASGRSGSSTTSGSLTAGRIPDAAIVEREVPTEFVSDGALRLSLRDPGFTLAARIATAIDEKLGAGTALASDGGTVVVRVPAAYDGRSVALAAALEDIEVTPERRARIVLSERTQTIVVAGDVRLRPAAVVHGSLTIVVKEQPKASQPAAPLTPGRTVVVPESKVKVEETTSTMRYLGGTQTLSDLADALGALGLSARELASVLQGLRTAGVLEAEIIVQ
ncbi:MAG: flagellar basal body P-ring protein FlgI [Myxococcales bacterium]|nr:flagellar basal body P-ring protein FlgI [Myxococcales bacterium]